MYSPATAAPRCRLENMYGRPLPVLPVDLLTSFLFVGMCFPSSRTWLGTLGRPSFPSSSLLQCLRSGLSFSFPLLASTRRPRPSSPPCIAHRLRHVRRLWSSTSFGRRGFG